MTHICSIFFFQFTLYFYYILGRQTTPMDMKSLISRASIDYVGRYVSLCALWWLMSFIIIVFTVTILRDTVMTSWSANDICLLILKISCWSDILVLYVFSSTLPVLACYIYCFNTCTKLVRKRRKSFVYLMSASIFHFQDLKANFPNWWP